MLDSPGTGAGTGFGVTLAIVPSWPALLSPHAGTMPPDFSAYAVVGPGPTAVIPLSGAPPDRTGAGVRPTEVVTFPSSPAVLSPQDMTWPLARSASEKNPWVAIAFTLLSPLILAGNRRLVVVPSPSCPKPLPPQL